ncbi:DUF397 domain-containing protein [Lipingzhangella sp. LS1_29]|uniref:DUF397 domain-containing protein n=1 Tax=Lipingzhangella rawalii TaxID=2055835 RepID=A0ABU2H8X2_9ACTN|nr:DUF397 domain-containing protein [Lipingzhangella rawalii]MDS1271299.1 DUF397 domain-containing protein [Lipingzhangella rawalii]
MSEQKATSPRVAWHVSSYSVNGRGECVEAGRVLDAPRVAVRDSTQRERGYLAVPHGEWAAFLRAVKTEQM